MNISLRGRYVIEMTATLALALLIFSMAVFMAVAGNLFFSVQAEAYGIAKRTAILLSIEGRGIRAREIQDAIVAFAAFAGTSVFVYGPGGQFLAETQFAAAPPSGNVSPGLQLGKNPFERAVVKSPAGTVIAEVPVGPDVTLLKGLALSLLIFLVLASAIVSLVSRRTVLRILGPVDRLTRRAREMRLTGRVGSFLEGKRAPDEFTRLADVLSALIDDLEERRLRDRRLLAEAAHEIRTPLQVLKGNLGYLDPKAEVDEGTRQESRASLERAVQRIAKLTEDILDLEQATEPARVVETVDVADVLGEIQEDAQAGLGRTLSLDMPAGGLAVRTDRTKLTRLLWILIENADRYTPAEGRIHLLATRREDGGTDVVVADEGPGIDPEELPRVFERFYRGKTARGTSGTGLGLAVARALAASMGAVLRLENRSEGGLSARVALAGDPPAKGR